MRFLDWQVEKSNQWMTPKRTSYLAIIMLDISVLTFFYAPFSGEPPVIYLMSALALMFAAILAIVEAERWSEEQED